MPDEDFLSKDHEVGVVSSTEYIDYLEKYVPKAPPVYTGMPMLDHHMGGAVPGEMWILSGPSKHGKSTFMRTMIKKYFEQGCLSMIFTFEETPQQFFDKFEEHKKQVLFFLPRIRKPYDIDDMLDKAREAKERCGARIMFIDSGQKVVKDVQRSANLAQVVGEMASRIKEFAVSEEMIVWLIWHLHKDDNVTLDSLGSNHLRDSERVFQESDGLVFAYRSINKNGLSVIQENYLKVCLTRRSGALEEVIPIVKRGPFFHEMDVEDI
jgi:predicted ATP-dependent serine protease